MIAGAFLLAGLVKGVIGGGLPTIAIGLLGSAMPPAQAAALILLPSFVTNVWQSMGKGFAALATRIALMLIGICGGAWFGAGILTGADASRARTALGITLVIYALFGLSRIEFQLSPRAERWLAIPVGLATGAMSAATGVFVIPSGPYLQAIGLKKDELVQALGMTYTVATIALGVTLAHGGFVQASLAGPSALALAAALAGMVIGQRLRKRVSEPAFRIIFFVGLLLLGGELALRALR
ncbi:MAG: sulfite exporter TauE/SafE family protein [Pseudolabrys sp.]|nr:sulfite exporter TauE/SafE family protein [Pseudolabrys sp.]